MLKTSINVIISVVAVIFIVSCARSYTASELRKTEPLVEMKILYSPKEAAYCIVELMDERMTLAGAKLSEGFFPTRYAMTNHVRYGDKTASIVSMSLGGGFIITIAPVPMFVVNIEAVDSGSLAMFHKEPGYESSKLAQKVEKIFRDCNR